MSDEASRPSPLSRLRSAAGRIRRWVRRTADRFLHPGRRRRARSLLTGLEPIRKPLFLCLGNVCRSPYAEARYRAEAGVEGDVPSGGATSAGFIGPGRPPPSHALDAARSRGLDTSGHRSRVVTADMVREADLVVLVDPSHRRRLRRVVGHYATPLVVLGDLDPEPVESRRIRDPWGSEGRVFDDVFDRIDRCIGELVELSTTPRIASRSP